MATTIWQSEIARIGPDATDMFEGGVYILFGEPVPDALAEVSLVHKGHAGEFVPVQAGDEFVLGDSAVTITAVGDLANSNLQELGHVVLYLNAEDTALLPGAIQATGTLPTPTEGATVSVRRNEA
ncbi:PTS glucitol/sorbitol transporter subunit IIA [Pseudoclavibacter helvolus]|uniref:PTS glucitol/sorbitol transporter subunit IIA n=1 Tax=Pseudoclavibacter helvolus TaxID=255205 RepID=UPI003C754004